MIILFKKWAVMVTENVEAGDDLPYIFCFLLDIPNENGTDYVNGTISDNTYFVRCPYQAKFQAGGALLEHGPGHKISVLIWVLTLIFGLLGTFTNSLIILIMKRHPCTKAFEILLTLLACFDLLCCIMSVLSTTGIITFMGKLY